MRNTKRAIGIAVTTVLATVASLALGAPGANALSSTCMYPPTTPVVSVGLSTTAPTTGQPVYVRGRLTYNKCGVGGRPVTVRAGGKTIGTPTTDAQGNYTARFTPSVNSSAYAASSFNNASAKSRTLGFAVRTNLRGTKALPVGNCRVTVKGTIYPVRKGATVVVQRRVVKGKKFIGWSTVAGPHTNNKGQYGATVTLPCAAKVGLSTYIAPTKINAGNRSSTMTVTAKN